MGDRGNVVIVGSDHPPIYLYSHWGGSELPFDVQRALRNGKSRWNDGAYLTRIIWDHVIGAVPSGTTPEMLDDYKEKEKLRPQYKPSLTGFGIATYQCDNEHLFVVVDPETRMVSFREEGADLSAAVLAGVGAGKQRMMRSWKFESYIRLSEKTLRAAFGEEDSDSERDTDVSAAAPVATA
jgi:hypothetical protein